MTFLVYLTRDTDKKSKIVCQDFFFFIINKLNSHAIFTESTVFTYILNYKCLKNTIGPRNHYLYNFGYRYNNKY